MIKLKKNLIYQAIMSRRASFKILTTPQEIKCSYFHVE